MFCDSANSPASLKKATARRPRTILGRAFAFDAPPRRVEFHGINVSVEPLIRPTRSSERFGLKNESATKRRRIVMKGRAIDTLLRITANKLPPNKQSIGGWRNKHHLFAGANKVTRFPTVRVGPITVMRLENRLSGWVCILAPNPKLVIDFKCWLSWHVSELCAFAFLPLRLLVSGDRPVRDPQCDLVPVEPLAFSYGICPLFPQSLFPSLWLWIVVSVVLHSEGLTATFAFIRAVAAALIVFARMVIDAMKSAFQDRIARDSSI